jgi:hypothetical protein
LHWLWIDVYVGVIIENRVELKDDEVRRAYEGYSIWQKFIEPWELWLK